MEETYEDYLQNLTDDEGEVRELTGEDFRRMKPISSLPSSIQQKLLSLKRPEPVAIDSPSILIHRDSTSIVIEGEIVDRYRQMGDGWEKRVESALRDGLRDHAA